MAMPELEYTDISIAYEKNELKSTFDSGAVLARKKYSRTRRTITAQPDFLTNAQLASLVEHFNEVGTVFSFVWIHPENVEEAYTVRFKEPISYHRSGNLKTHYTVDKFTLEEV